MISTPEFNQKIRALNKINNTDDNFAQYNSNFYGMLLFFNILYHIILLEVSTYRTMCFRSCLGRSNG